MNELQRAHRWDRVNRAIFVFCAAWVAITILAVVLFVGKQGLATFGEVSPGGFFFSPRWAPTEGEFGALTFIVGSAATTIMAIVLAWPLGLATAVFMVKLAPRAGREVVRQAIDLLVGIPSVVYGSVGLTVLVPWLRTHFGGAGFGLLAAALVLAVMILPTIVGLSVSALQALPGTLDEAALALGATRWQSIWRVLLPAARPGLMTAVVLATARAAGEATAVQMVIGNTPLLPRTFVNPTATLTSEIIVEMTTTPFGSTWNNALFLMSFLLLAMSLVTILVLRWLGRGGQATLGGGARA